MTTSVTTSVTTRPPAEWGRDCAYCGNEFEPTDKGHRAIFCSGKCRQRAYNARRRLARQEQAQAQQEADDPQALDAPGTSVISAVLTEHLTILGAADSVEGRAALTLAKRIDAYGQQESGSGLAALVRELRSSLAIVAPSAGARPHHSRDPEDDDDESDGDVVVQMARQRDARRRN